MNTTQTTLTEDEIRAEYRRATTAAQVEIEIKGTRFSVEKLIDGAGSVSYRLKAGALSVGTCRVSSGVMLLVDNASGRGESPRGLHDVRLVDANGVLAVAS